jgi:hypothetical protein
MNSTIHDLYFSDTNFNYIYNLITTLILNETRYNISNNDKYLKIYKLNYPKYFNNYDTDDISYLNKKLVDDIGDIILKDIKNLPVKNKISYKIIKYKSIMIDDYEHICVKIENNKIEVNENIDFYQDDKYLNTLTCNKVMDNYIFFLAKGFNSKANKIIT